MAIIKCKMCGGDIVLSEDKTYGTCEYCGSTMTFPRVSDEQRLNLFNRANHFRRQNEFDKAIAAYEKILEQDDTDAEAHWGAVLSQYGIEYVEDPVTHERIPTCHRVQLQPILTDGDYLDAVKHAPDTASRDIYEKEARRIADIQKGILAISSQEKPYDVFICYKESDDSGSRTVDSTLAQEIYYQLTNEGYKVFFSRITLEDKLGQEYEPYIFAALNSAKVMLVVGTKPENFNAVWVKNEWSRYLDLMKSDRSKLLIPCYRDMDPYDLPEALSALQSQDMSKIGFMQDLIRGVKKVLGTEKEVKPAVAAPGVASLHKRAVLFLEDGDWDQANEYFDRILDIDPEFAPAYIGKVQVANKVRKEDGLARCAQPLKGNNDYQKALRFADEQHKTIYEGYNRAIEERITLERKEAAYREADALEKRAAVEADFLNAAKKYDEAGEIRDAKTRAADCRAKAAAARQAAERQAEEYRRQLEAEREERRRKEEEARLEAERKAEQKRKEEQERAERQRIERERREREERIAEEKRRKRNRTVATVLIILALLGAGGFAGYKYVYQPKQQYAAAQELLDAGHYDEAVEAFTALGSYSDSVEKVKESYYQKAKAFLNVDKLVLARESFALADDYFDASKQVQRIDDYTTAEAAYAQGDYLTARPLYTALGDYRDATTKLDAANRALYADATTKMLSGDIAGAYDIYDQISDYADSAEITAQVEADYQSALDLWEKGDKTGAEASFVALAGWNDVDARLESLREEIADDAAEIEDYDTALTYYNKIQNKTDAVTSKADEAAKAKAYIEAGVALDAGDLSLALAKYKQAGDHADAIAEATRLNDYLAANKWMEDENYREAIGIYSDLGDYLDSVASLEMCKKRLYAEADDRFEEGDIALAHEYYTTLNGYADSTEKAKAIASEYESAVVLMDESKYDEAIEVFTQLHNYADSETKVKDCKYQKAGALNASGAFTDAAVIYEELGDYLDSANKASESHYDNAKALWAAGELQEAAEEFKNLGDYSDAAQQLVGISTQVADAALADGDYASALTAYMRLEQSDEIKAKEYELAQLCYDGGNYAEATSAYEMLGQYELSLSKLPIARYAWADQLFSEGSYAEAAEQFALLGDMTDSSDRSKESIYQQAKIQMDSKDYDSAKTTFQLVKGYSDADVMVQECDYRKANELLDGGNYEDAQELFAGLGKYSDSATKADECIYLRAEALVITGDYSEAQELFSSIDYKDSMDKANMCVYNQASVLLSNDNYIDAESMFGLINGYKDSNDKAKECRIKQALVLMEKEDYEGALSYLDNLEYQNSRELVAQCHYEQGIKEYEGTNYDIAVREFAKAESIDGAKEKLYEIGKHYASIGEYENALEACSYAVPYDSVDSLLEELGQLFAQKGDSGLEFISYCVADSDSNANSNYLKMSETIDNDRVYAFSKEMNNDFSFYVLGNELFKRKDYSQAIMCYEKDHMYGDTEDKYSYCCYQIGTEALADGNLELAFSFLWRIIDYAEAYKIVANNPKLLEVVYSKEGYEIGHKVAFGEHEWYVLDIQNSKALLLSSSYWEGISWKGTSSEVTWETSNAKKWLNDTFYNSAFDEEEKSRIIIGKPNESGAHVFLLSKNEAERYENRLISDRQKWWLRTTNYINYGFNISDVKVYYMNDNQSTIYGIKSMIQSEHPGKTDIYIRPAIWIDLGWLMSSSAQLKNINFGIAESGEAGGIDNAEVNGDEGNSEMRNRMDTGSSEDTASIAEYAVLTKGDKNADVQELQQALIDQGYLSGKADGDFGKKTEEAVKKAQRVFDMEQTGIADDIFQKRLYGE